jgi:hypothetical protein
MALTLVGLLMLIGLNATISLGYIIAVMLVLGLGFALFSSPNTNAIMGSVDRRHYGVTGAMVGTMRQIGMMMSMGIVMMILALHLGQAEIDTSNLSEFVSSIHTTFIVLSVMCFGGIFASLARGKMNRG